MANISPELAELLERHRVVDEEMIRAINKAEALEMAIDRGDAEAIARGAELKGLLKAQREAERASDAVIFAIAAFPSRSVADVAAKMRIVACEIEGLTIGPGATAAAGETIDIAFTRGVALDLNRLASA